MFCAINQAPPKTSDGMNKKTKEKTYYIPTSIMYKTITIEEENNDRWFCTEQEAQLQGWIKSKH